jgi:hypothetical protein
MVWVVMLCGLVGGYQRFVGIYRLHLQDGDVRRLYRRRMACGNGDKEEGSGGLRP